MTQAAAPYDLAVPGTAFFTGAFFGALYPVYVRGLAYAGLGRPARPPRSFKTFSIMIQTFRSWSKPKSNSQACSKRHSYWRRDREGPMDASTSGGDAERQLAAFIRKFTPIDQRLIRA